MIIGTAETTKLIDEKCINDIKIPSIVLMENAALRALTHVDDEERYTIVCGNGNNGGDGLVIAKHLILKGKKVKVAQVGSTSKQMSKDCKTNYEILVNMGVEIVHIKDKNDLLKLENFIKDSDLIIDAIIGVGLKSEVIGLTAKIIDIINKLDIYTISIDVPSGFNSDTGVVCGTCVKADKTITFQTYKRGFTHNSAYQYTGTVIVENIGIPKRVINSVCTKESIITEAYITNVFKPRVLNAHKGDFGNVLVIAGGKGYVGAPAITTNACVRTGTGLTTLATRTEVIDVIGTKLLEAMICDIADNKEFEQKINKSDVIAIGPGMGDSEDTLKTLKMCIKKHKGIMVIDADGLNVLKDNRELLKEYKGEIILTPHPGEMSRLTGFTIEEIENNRLDIAKRFAKEWGITLVLKGYRTIVTDGINTKVNIVGNSAMANGGTGDALTGIIASLAGQGYNRFEAACAGVYIHGISCESLSDNMFTVNASHLIENLPIMMKKYFK